MKNLGYLLKSQNISVKNVLELVLKKNICVNQLNYSKAIMNMKRLLILLVINYFIINCSEQITDTSLFKPFEVNIRMEVQILDTTYQIYSRPFTKIYFTSYKLSLDGIMVDFDQSDTTSCPNGWGVKLLTFTLNNSDEIIYLGAACDNYHGPNFREMRINYQEAERRIDSTGHSGIVKTFAIYYN